LYDNKLAMFSFTTGGTEEMYVKGSMSGDIRYILWPMQHGIMHFCGVKILEPHICFAPEYVSEEKRKEMLLAWAHRLKTLWKEEPINCSPEWYFNCGESTFLSKRHKENIFKLPKEGLKNK
uniref:Flavodoxin-like fold domain-containing protein n=1 Tax=Pavo cristatus TaxID=9049 RepID=A0A8C9FH33_PAVCR